MKDLQHGLESSLVLRLAARTAHDLNNAAAALSGHIYLLRLSAEPLEEACAALEKVQENLQQLTRGLAALATLGVGEAATLDLNELVHAAARDPANRAFRIELDLDAALAPIRGRHADLRQALDALLGNAREASQAGSVIRVSTRGLTQPTATVVAVEDSGSGVPPEIRPRIFEPFFSTKGERGRGMGLTLVATAALLHGGSCKVEEREEGGTRALLCLPDG